MLQTHVVNVSSVSDICYNKCFILQLLHEQARQRVQAKVVPLGLRAHRKRSGHGSRHGAQSCIHGRGNRHEARSCIHGYLAGAEHEAKRSTELPL
jgi:hypothetical protein